MLQTTMQMCVKIVMGEPGPGAGEEASLSSVQGIRPPQTVLSPYAPPPPFHTATLRMLAFMMQALGVSPTSDKTGRRTRQDGFDRTRRSHWSTSAAPSPSASIPRIKWRRCSATSSCPCSFAHPRPTRVPLTRAFRGGGEGKVRASLQRRRWCGRRSWS